MNTTTAATAVANKLANVFGSSVGGSGKMFGGGNEIIFNTYIQIYTGLLSHAFPLGVQPGSNRNILLGLHYCAMEGAQIVSSQWLQTSKTRSPAVRKQRAASTRPRAVASRPRLTKVQAA